MARQFLCVLFYICGMLHVIQSLHSTNIRLEKIRQEVTITEQYEFQLPVVDIHCACCINRAIRCEKHCINEIRLKSICVTANVSDRAECSISVRQASKQKRFTAYKINHTNQQVYFTISYGNGNNREQIEIPRGISQVKTADDSILKFDTSFFNIDVLNAFPWFYGETDSNNIRCATEINDVNENDLLKLGWYRLNLTSGKYYAYEKAVANSLMIDDRKCPTEDVQWDFKAVHYYNHGGLLQSSLPGKTVNEITGGIVDNVKINTQNKIMLIEYYSNSHIIQFSPMYSPDSFNFSAYVSLDKYANKLIHVTVYELEATTVNVEVGIPGITRSMISFYHEKPNQIHRHRISASIIGPQWVCAYPAKEFPRCTCVNAYYLDESIPNRSFNLPNITRNNFGQSPNKSHNFENEVATAFSQSNFVDEISNISYYILIGILVLMAFGLVLLVTRVTN